jgi:predicted ATPase
MDEIMKYWTCRNERRRNARANLIFLDRDSAASVSLLTVSSHQEETN